MKIKQQANCSIAIRRFDTGENIEFLKNSVFDLDEATANYLLGLDESNFKVISNGNITDPDGILIPAGTLCSDFVIVKE